MKTYSLFLMVFLIVASKLSAQDSIVSRVILIGDAGEINPYQTATINRAASKALMNKTTVLFLGDNIYPTGIGLPGSKNEQSTKAILQSQYQPFRLKNAAVYFIPGNHDWDKSGTLGFEKVKYQSQFLLDQGDSLLQPLPANGCPGPVAIEVTPQLTIIAFDSEWWLFPFDIDNTGCECKNKKDFIAKLEELLYKNRNKTILVASHHPFKTYGVHGGYFTLKDHLFPLTAVNKNLFIPLPLIGSIYPLFRSTFSNSEDVHHPLYKNMIESVETVFKNFPNVAFVAGHEHTLQLIKNKHLQIVSGSGSKHTAVKKGKNALFASSQQGYVIADLLTNGSMEFKYYSVADTITEPVFTYILPHTPIHEAEELDKKIIAADSITINIRPDYDKKSKLHRFFFGENYRKEWAAPTTLPVIKISSFSGGLTPLQLGGGFQSQSLRLKDNSGKEWIIRSVEKTPDALLPSNIRNTFARDWIDDVTSAQHPYSALVVPTIAHAVNVPHANPVIGVISPDKNLGVYGRIFNNMIVLLEEREPLGKSDNTIKMLANLQKDNDNKINAIDFLRARMLDAFLGDWDRHEDQWRWHYNENKNKIYTGIPRDRDQVFHLTQGLFPKIASFGFLLPTLRNFDAKMSQIKWLLFKTKFVHAYPEFQLSRADWSKTATEFTAALTDSVLETALKKLPQSSWQLRHSTLLQTMQSRRKYLPEVMDKYYRFIQKIVDIKLSDKNEFVQITDAANGSIHIQVFKKTKEGNLKDVLMNKTYDASLTKEVRLYTGSGNDSIVLNNKNASVKLRLIGGNGQKAYNIIASNKKVQLYDKPNASVFIGDTGMLKKHISADTAITSFVPVNLYNIWRTLLIVGSNVDDGFILGATFKFEKQEGFRKLPYASLHQFGIAHSFSTKAYRASYRGEWIQAIGKADLIIEADVRAPNNTINFFGRGNQSSFDKSGTDIRFYRTRFSTYRFDPALRFNGSKGSMLSFGPSLYYYRLDLEDNAGRLITNPANIGSYDSSSIDKSKLHLGFTAHFIHDKRNNKIVPQWGTYVNIKILAYKGIGNFAKDFSQLISEVAVYKSLNRKSTIVLAERFGGTVSVGNTTFYQSAFIGGHENLLGYRQYRFSGEQSFYNNIELRIKLADIASYITPGQLGFISFWDVGRVWQKNRPSTKWHSGLGAGIYFAPASMAVFNFVMGKSEEGWYPYFTMGFRF